MERAHDRGVQHPEELRFRFVAGRPCLDLVATVGERWRRGVERLRTPADLGRWLVEAGLLPSRPRVSARQVEETRELREAIHRAARAILARRSVRAADARLINRWAARPTSAPQLDPASGQVVWMARRPVEAALAAVARDAVDLFGGPWAGRIRECAAEDCSLLFVDASGPGRRRWCSMDRCGNRAKVAAYRRRRAGGTRSEGRWTR